MNREKHYLPKERLEMFSDGVFAIAITLLILEIKIPSHSNLLQSGGLYKHLLHLWPNYISYCLGFCIIGIYWSNHHWLFGFIKKTNHVFNLLNIAFLMTIAFIPFTTAILGEFILDTQNHNAAITTFALGMLFPIPVILLIYLYATQKHRLVATNLSTKFINKQTLKLISGFFLTLIAVLLSFQYPNITLAIIGVSLTVYLLPPDKPEFNLENKAI